MSRKSLGKGVLGKTYRDKISGYTGVVDAVTEWLNGCVRYTLSSKDKDGCPQSFAFDVEQLDEVKDIPSIKTKATPTGGPRDNKPMSRR